MRTIAIIGGAFGDEGKCLMTDYLATEATLVVRFNGGAQAGHTVCTPEKAGKKRHVFHHFGSGTMRGAMTYLSRHFIVNPLLWKKELDELKLLGIQPHTYIDLQARVTTPYDMLINQELERSRGKNRHGSCGVGINETVERCSFDDRFWLRVSDIFGTHLEWVLRGIRDYWVPRRLQDLNITLSKQGQEFLDSSGLFNSFLRVCDQMNEDEYTFLASSSSIRDTIPDQKFERVIFEGAQGLLLDERCDKFHPHVTSSRTGIDNVINICNDLDLDMNEVEPVYVLRPYLTRHGVGPLPNEDVLLKFFDETNVENEWQGPMRFGRMDEALVAEAIKDDLLATGMEGEARLAVTHLDQVQQWGESYGPDLLQRLAVATGVPVGYTSRGPTRDDVTCLVKEA